ncbi:peptidoglycan-binding domain-containing protein [Streptomyces pratensis]|uniref:peptidoglycan-binding domain-containing protein n=1 Tax=Streptomyces pratensis TaxID=1169025 RepID=UPI003630C8C8
MTGHMCPECGGEQSARPGAGCACGAGTAARTGRDARAAEIAAAEDFDPLRIRPYVTLNSDDTQDHGAPDAATTMPLFLDATPGGAPGPVPGTPPGAVAADQGRRRIAAAYAGDGPDPVQPRRRRPFAVIAVGAAVAAVVGTAAFAGGLFDDEDGAGNTALPEVTTSTPDTSEEPATTVSESPSASPSATPSRSASASPSASASASPSDSPSASRSAVASESPAPSASATKAPTTAPATPPAEEVSGTTLRRGDRGAEVSELQRRLEEIWVYRGPTDGDYSERVEEAVAEFQRWVSVRSDPPGVYGPETRSALEAQTNGRGHRS